MREVAEVVAAVGANTIDRIIETMLMLEVSQMLLVMKRL